MGYFCSSNPYTREKLDGVGGSAEPTKEHEPHNITQGGNVAAAECNYRPYRRSAECKCKTFFRARKGGHTYFFRTNSTTTAVTRMRAEATAARESLQRRMIPNKHSEKTLLSPAKTKWATASHRRAPSNCFSWHGQIWLVISMPKHTPLRSFKLFPMNFRKLSHVYIWLYDSSHSLRTPRTGSHALHYKHGYNTQSCCNFFVGVAHILPACSVFFIPSWRRAAAVSKKYPARRKTVSPPPGSRHV